MNRLLGGWKPLSSGPPKGGCGELDEDAAGAASRPGSPVLGCSCVVSSSVEGWSLRESGIREELKVEDRRMGGRPTNDEARCGALFDPDGCCCG